MKIITKPINEGERLAALKEYCILDTLQEASYDQITKIAAGICKMPVSLISLLDSDRVFVKSNYGLKLKEALRVLSLCAHTINSAEDVFIVKDARTDIRYCNHPYVLNSPNIVFYAGIPLIDSEGFALGTLCVIDGVPRELDENQIESLKALANQVIKLFELRKKNRLLDESLSELKNRNTELEHFAYVVSHDIKSPLNNIMGISEMLKSEYADKLDAPAVEMIDGLTTSSVSLKHFVDGIISYYTGDKIFTQEKAEIDFTTFCEGLLFLLNPQNEFVLNYPKNHLNIIVNESALAQILMNLISNSIKYNSSNEVITDISLTVDTKFYSFSVKDNGRGIDEKELENIFDIFVTLGKKDRYNTIGTGIGLSIVKKMVEKLGGNIQVSSELNVGSEFKFRIKR